MEVRMTDGLFPNGSLLERWQTLWDDVPAAPRAMTPAADVVEDAEGYRFYFEMPGVKSDGIDVGIEDGRLVIEAERRRPEWPEDAEIHRAERAYGKLSRSFKLPEDAQHEAIAASYHDGVLEVKVPKRPESKPRKVKVEFQN
jgi:HSP20 family protein